MKIAVVGSGISGLAAAHRLRGQAHLTLFEAGDYFGGHTHTVDVEAGGERYAVDTGFIVFNDWTYPNFLRLLGELGVESQSTSMSFSVSCERTGLEYNGTSLATLFADRRNLLRPRFYRMLADIVRFGRDAHAFLGTGNDTATLGDFLETHGYSGAVVEHYVVQIGRAHV